MFNKENKAYGIELNTLIELIPDKDQTPGTFYLPFHVPRFLSLAAVFFAVSLHSLSLLQDALIRSHDCDHHSDLESHKMMTILIWSFVW
jgi:hypothetical protein